MDAQFLADLCKPLLESVETRSLAGGLRDVHNNDHGEVFTYDGLADVPDITGKFVDGGGQTNYNSCTVTAICGDDDSLWLVVLGTRARGDGALAQYGSHLLSNHPCGFRIEGSKLLHNPGNNGFGHFFVLIYTHGGES